MKIGKIGSIGKIGGGNGIFPIALNLDFGSSPFIKKAPGALTLTQNNVDVWTVTDHEGIVRTVPQNAYPRGGLRMVQNFCDPNFSNWSESVAGTGSTSVVDGIMTCTLLASGDRAYRYLNIARLTIGRSYRVSFRILSWSGDAPTRQIARLQSGFSANEALTADNVSRLAVAVGVATATTVQLKIGLGCNAIEDGARVATFGHPMLEDVTGATITAPSEYIDSTTVQPSSGIAGFAYYDTTNGNTVDGNGVVTEGAGTAITGGYLSQQLARTNSLLYSYALESSYGALATNFTITSVDSELYSTHKARQLAHSVGDSGTVDVGTFTGSAETIWFDVSNVDAVSSEIGVYNTTTPGWVARVKITWATHAASVPAGSGTAFATQVSTNVWRVGITYTGTASAGRRVYLYPIGSGATGKTAVIHQVQLETGAFSTNPILTSGSAVPRNAMTLTAPNPMKDAQGAAYIEFQIPVSSALLGDKYLLSVNSGTIGIYINSSDFKLTVSDGANTTTAATLSAATTYKAVAAWTGTTMRLTLNGTTYTGTYDGAMNGATERIGGIVSGSGEITGKLYSLKEYKIALTQAQAEAMTS